MENTKQLTVKNCVKYLIFAGVIYGVLKIVPTQKLTNIEMTILIIIILLGIFSLDCLTVSKQNKEGMSNAKKIFDLDLDVDLDFNKASSDYKETNTDIKTTESNESNESVISEKGINLDEVKKELNKKASAKKSVIDSEISTDSSSSIEEKTESDTDEKETEEVKKEKAKVKKEKAKVEKEKAKVEKEREKVEKEKVEKKKEQVKKEKEEKKEELKKKISEMKKELKKKIAEGKEEARKEKEEKSKNELETKAVNCEVEVAKMKRHLEETISKLRDELKSKTTASSKSKHGKKYLNILIADLLDKKIIDKNDVENTNAKLISGASTLDEVIQSYEKLRSIGVPKKVSEPKDRTNDMKYSDLPSKSYKPIGKGIANQWTNEYTILNTDKWQVSQPRPPVCVSSGPCKVCPSSTEGYPTSLKEWDNSRVITNNKINKKWALDQADSS